MSEECLLITVVGPPGSGKTCCLEHIREPEKVLYINYDGKSRFPFKQAKGKKFIVETPKTSRELFTILAELQNAPDIKIVVLDTITKWFDMYIADTVLKSSNTLQAWGTLKTIYESLLKAIRLLDNKVFIILAHTELITNEETREVEAVIETKGKALCKPGMEADLENIVRAVAIPITKAQQIKNDLLTVTEEEMKHVSKLKYVLQTQAIENDSFKRIRTAKGAFTGDELYIDSNIQQVIDRLQQFYNDED